MQQYSVSTSAAAVLHITVFSCKHCVSHPVIFDYTGYITVVFHILVMCLGFWGHNTTSNGLNTGEENFQYTAV
jgi:hypothetical protein